MVVILGTLAIIAPMSAASGRADGLPRRDVASVIGQWTPPFEEGGAALPRCVRDSPEGDWRCKPAAAKIAALPDGRESYFNGFEGTENVRHATLTELAPAARNDQARVLDLRSGQPSFIMPVQPTGGGRNRDHTTGARGTDDPLGMAGIPGSPGDGLVGSVWGAVGGPAHSRDGVAGLGERGSCG